MVEFPDIKSAKVLVVDDDQDILVSLKTGLQLPGIELEILTAEDGLSGLQQAKLHRPDIIVLDLQMPDMNGFEVLKEIHADPQLSKTKVIMLTAQDSVQNLWEGIDRQLDDFMGKPFDLGELEARIYNQLLALHNQGS
jgi:DNA-binding response OmpR family regulator